MAHIQAETGLINQCIANAFLFSYEGKWIQTYLQQRGADTGVRYDGFMVKII